MKEFWKKRKNWILLVLFLVVIFIGMFIPKDFLEKPPIPKYLFEEYRLQENIDSSYNKKIIKTNEKLDISIVGDGLFRLELENGEEAYSRYGKFTLNNNRVIVTYHNHYKLYPTIRFDNNIDIKDILIKENGKIYLMSGSSEQNTYIGQIKLYDFQDLKNLIQIDKYLYKKKSIENIESTMGLPQSENFGSIYQGYLENLRDIFDIEKITYINESEKTIISKDKTTESIWILNGNNFVNVDDLKRLFVHISNIEYIDKKEIKDITELTKWDINDKSDKIAFDIYGKTRIINIGSDMEEIGYYYIALDNNKNFVYVIEEYQINILKSMIKNLQN